MSQDLINIIIGCSLAICGWFSRVIWYAVFELKSDLAKLREELPTNYLPKDEYRDDIREMKEMLIKLYDKLDKKVDK